MRAVPNGARHLDPAQRARLTIREPIDPGTPSAISQASHSCRPFLKKRFGPCCRDRLAKMMGEKQLADAKPCFSFLFALLCDSTDSSDSWYINDTLVLNVVI
jgi:hypothetical protein